MAKKPKIKIRNTFKGNVGQVNNIDTYQGCFEGPKLKLIVFLLLAILSILTKKTYAGHNIDNAKNTIQLDDSIKE